MCRSMLSSTMFYCGLRATLVLVAYMATGSMAAHRFGADTVELSASGMARPSVALPTFPSEGSLSVAATTLASAGTETKHRTQAKRSMSAKMHAQSVAINKTQRATRSSIQHLHVAKARALGLKHAISAETKRVRAASNGKITKSQRLAALLHRYHEAVREVTTAERSLDRAKQRLTSARAKYTSFAKVAPSKLPTRNVSSSKSSTTFKRGSGHPKVSTKTHKFHPNSSVASRTQQANIDVHNSIGDGDAALAESAEEVAVDAIQQEMMELEAEAKEEAIELEGEEQEEDD